MAAESLGFGFVETVDGDLTFFYQPTSGMHPAFDVTTKATKSRIYKSTNFEAVGQLIQNQAYALISQTIEKNDSTGNHPMRPKEITWIVD